MQPVARETFVERRQSHLRWSAILGGLAVAVAAWLALQLLGSGIGMSTIEVDDAGSVRGAGIGVGVWSLIAPLLALFAGGYVAARLAGILDKQHAALHGAVLWGLATLLGSFLVMRAVGQIAGTASRVASGSADVVKSAAGGIDPSWLDQLGVSDDDIVGPINTKLREQGKPELSPEELTAAVRDTMRRSVRAGGFDRKIAVDSLTRHTALSRRDAEDVATQLEARYDEGKARVDELGDDAARTARSAGDKAGKVMLGAGAALLVGLASAMAGAVLGTHRRRRDDDEDLRRRHTTLHGIPTPPVSPGPAPDAAV